MFRPRILPASPRRRAVILMVVLVLLTLFAIVGLAFVLYAESEGEASRVYRESTTSINLIDISPDSLAGYGFGQFIFGVNDQPLATTGATGPFPTGPWSAMRGYDLGRDLWGWDSDDPGSNISPFNGVGRMHNPVIAPSPPYPPGTVIFPDEHATISYVPYIADGFVHDPERYGTRTDLSKPLGPFTGGFNSSYTYPDGNHVFLGAHDQNGTILARSFHRPYLIPTNPVPTAAGFGRPYLPLDPNDPNYWSWTSNQNPNNPADVIPAALQTGLKYFCLRPRNVDMGPGFPLPGLGGDVKNLTGFPGGNDSVWIDLDYPVQQAQDGTKWKPLFAFFITDLDGRINLNTHGNVRGASGGHMSNQGWGPWEINPAWLSSVVQPAAGAEWSQVFLGSPTNPRGRYGSDKAPGTPPPGGVAIAGKSPHVYGAVDYDAANPDGPPPPLGPAPGGGPTPRWSLPGAGQAFPNFPGGYGNGSAAERTAHPLLYDSDWPQYPLRSDDLRFSPNNLAALFNGGPNALSCPLGQLLPTNMGDYRIRNMITTESAALDRPGLTPWIFDRGLTSGPTANTYGYGPGAGSQFPPTGNPIPFPALSSRLPPPPPPAATMPGNSEFRFPGANFWLPPNPPTKPNPYPNPQIDWRAVDVTLDSTNLSLALSRVDLNRFLPPYPQHGSGTSVATYVPGAMVRDPATGVKLQPYDRWDGWPNSTNILNQAQSALQARQQMADDIYRRLLLVVGIPPVTTQTIGGVTYNAANPAPSDLAPRRWLAQLAANIVDYIDEDDISTPFNFYNTRDGLAATNVGATSALGSISPGAPPTVDQNPSYWVFGTELPKVLINEVLGEYPQPPAAGGTFNVNVFVELYNPLPAPPATSGYDPADGAAVPLYMAAQPGNTGAAYNPYQLVIADNNINVVSGAATLPNLPGLALTGTASPYNNDAVLGTPNTVRGGADFSGTATIVGAAPPAPPPTQIGGSSPQFFLVGPSGSDANGSIGVPPTAAKGVVPPNTPMLTSPTMTYTVTQDATGGWHWGTLATNPPINDQKPAGAGYGVNVLLRRLSNPRLPYDPNPTVMAGTPPAPVPNPNYNPYITIDYIGGGVSSGGSPPAKGAAVPLNPNNGTTVSSYSTTSKLQPYAAYPTLVQQATLPAAPPAQTTYATWGSLNITPPPTAGAPANMLAPAAANGQYDWLVHLDRQLISPMELLHVSGFAPYDLTRQFASPPPGSGGGAAAPVKQWNHRVDWYNEQNRLYRIFEYLITGDRAFNVSPSGRRPGMVNINTIFNPEVLLALCDPQTSNGFNQTQVNTIFQQMLKLRSPGLVPPAPPVPGWTPQITGKDQPFFGMGIGNMVPAPLAPGATSDPVVCNDDGSPKTYPSTGGPRPMGIEDTFLRTFAGAAPTGTVWNEPQRLFDVPGNHPYQVKELMTKIYSNITTRSNVFAVWMTVGFFQVTDDSVRPVKLGPEIGAATGNNIRHRMFAVVDRSRMMISASVPATTTVNAPTGAVTGLDQPTWVQVEGTQGANPVTGAPVITGFANPNNPVKIPWSIQAGAVLNMDPGFQTEETVVVLAVSPTAPPGLGPGLPNKSWIQAQFHKPHGPGVGINIPGNPGPQPSFSITAPGFPGLVLGYTVLE
jgi:hypothetical protein